MDPYDDIVNDASTDSVLLELAAHPLSSINPPPRDLPDLLDCLIASDSHLREKLHLCDKMKHDLGNQTRLIRKRAEDFDNANRHLINRVPLSSLTSKNSEYMIPSAHSFLLCHMVWQLSFLVSKFAVDFKDHLEQLSTAHKHIFGEFLGERHDHPGIEIADSTSMTCSDSCDWYFCNGPYEWSKKPYTKEWWKELNDTDWDWIRVREHIKNTIAETRKAIMNLDMFHGNIVKFLPPWVWYDDPNTWGVKGEIVNVEGINGERKGEVKLRIWFEKTDQMRTNERIAAENKQRQQWVAEGMHQSEAATKPVNIEINAIAIQLIDEKAIFDGQAMTPDWDNGGKHCRVGSWMNWWGFGQWLDNLKAARAKEKAQLFAETT